MIADGITRAKRPPRASARASLDASLVRGGSGRRNSYRRGHSRGRQGGSAAALQRRTEAHAAHV